jgi:GMP synthase-like glutamine amidotransferase
MRILVVDNNILKPYWGARDLARFAAEVPGATVEVRRAPQGDLPSDPLRYDRVVISGSVTSCLDDSPWVHRLDETIGRWLEAGTPMLGVCYGHQSIVRVLGGRESLGRNPRPEFGWTRIEKLADSKLLDGLPGAFWSYSSHYEEVQKLPKPLRLVARSELCGVQAFEMEGKPVWGIQFHPEKNLEEAKAELESKLKKGEPKELLHPTESDKLYDGGVGATLFRNFFTRGNS